MNTPLQSLKMSDRNNKSDDDSNASDRPGDFHHDEPDDLLIKVQRGKSSVPATYRKGLPITPVDGSTSQEGRRLCRPVGCPSILA